ncbi:hypothetical protein [Streptomyces sp. NBC_01180]|uniref:hypothetical protein n=1 Tax=Streptomyces sp. NBC_01180 TaxID=2903763 RepID=UPI0038707FA9|nr:hypothetical protein OG708_09115 [Streptomyces sp. NBC_01180]
MANGHSVTNDGAVMLLVSNGSADTDATITFNLVRTVDGQSVVPRVVTVGFARSIALGTFAVADYGTPLTFDVSSADISIQALKI